MSWHASLKLDYSREGGRSVARFAHDGPLRILQSLWPEGDAVCHNVLVHPPGGLVGGDTLDIDVSAAPGSHGLVTTPGATRFYRSEGEAAVQRAILLDPFLEIRDRVAADAEFDQVKGHVRFNHVRAAGNIRQCTAGYSSVLSTIRRAPSATCAPGSAAISAISASAGATSTCSIFIASTMARR